MPANHPAANKGFSDVIGAAIKARDEGINVTPEIMIPLVGSVSEFTYLKDIEKAFPIVSEVLIDERNKILAQNIKKAPGKKILAIVGAAHIPGILKYINEDIDITEINNKVIKPKSSKIKGWIIPALIISMIAITCFKNFDVSNRSFIHDICARLRNTIFYCAKTF